MAVDSKAFCGKTVQVAAVIPSTQALVKVRYAAPPDIATESGADQEKNADINA